MRIIPFISLWLSVMWVKSSAQPVPQAGAPAPGGVQVRPDGGVSVDVPTTNVEVGPRNPDGRGGRQVSVRAGPVGVFVDPANHAIGKPFQFAFDLPKIVSVGVRAGAPGQTGVQVNLPILDFLKGLFAVPPPPPPGGPFPPPAVVGEPVPPPVYLKPQDQNIDVGNQDPEANLIQRSKGKKAA